LILSLCRSFFAVFVAQHFAHTFQARSARGLDQHHVARPHETLYGIYQGVPLSDRSSLDPPLLPDKITIFAAPLLEDFPDPEDLHEEIRLTVLHEIAHYFGMDEEEIEDLGY